MNSMNRLMSSALGVVLLVGPATAASADDALFGVRAGYYTEAEGPFLADEFTANADFHYDFPSHGHAFVWAGAGLAVVHVDPEGRADGDTDAAANFLLGVGLSRHR